MTLIVGACGCGGKPDERSGSRAAPAASGRPTEKKSTTTVSAATDGPVRVVTGEQLIERIRLSGAKGTIVNAWASWCGPCRREFPMLIALRDSLASDHIAVEFVSVDESDSWGAAKDFATQNGLALPLLVASRPLRPFKTALNPEWPGMLPATFLFDSTGKLRYFWGGPVYESELLPVIEGFLAGKPIDGNSRFGLRPGKDLRPN
jgi:thiol-disulfide isomerase/thioredoxin